ATVVLLAIFCSDPGGLNAQTWVALRTCEPPLGAFAISSSTNGVKFLAAGWGGSGIWTSTNSGATWLSNRVALADLEDLHSTASSSDGTKLVVGAYDNGINGPWGPIYYSTNSGLNWRLSDAPLRAWESIASSSDGSRMVAAEEQLMGSFPNQIV